MLLLSQLFALLFSSATN